MCLMNVRGEKRQKDDSGIFSVSKEQRKLLKEEISGIGLTGCLHFPHSDSNSNKSAMRLRG